jgi:hypothetical protein
MTRPANSNGKRHATQQSVNSAVKAICDIMRRSNCAGALQYVPELTWILFLRILDERETREAEEAEAVNAEFTPSLAGLGCPRRCEAEGIAERRARRVLWFRERRIDSAFEKTARATERRAAPEGHQRNFLQR